MTILRQTLNMQLRQDRNGRPYLYAMNKSSRPRVLWVPRSSIQYLNSLPDASFEAAAVWDYGFTPEVAE